MNASVAFAGGAGALLGVFVGHFFGKTLTRGHDPTTEAFSTAIGAVAGAAIAAGIIAPQATSTSTAMTTTPGTTTG
jgi:hypothetical protein